MLFVPGFEHRHFVWPLAIIKDRQVQAYWFFEGEYLPRCCRHLAAIVVKSDRKYDPSIGIYSSKILDHKNTLYALYFILSKRTTFKCALYVSIKRLLVVKSYKYEMCFFWLFVLASSPTFLWIISAPKYFIAVKINQLKNNKACLSLVILIMTAKNDHANPFQLTLTP